MTPPARKKRAHIYETVKPVIVIEDKENCVQSAKVRDEALSRPLLPRKAREKMLMVESPIGGGKPPMSPRTRKVPKRNQSLDHVSGDHQPKV